MIINKSEISAVILAGGKSERMGQDKAFIQWKGKSFIQHILTTVSHFTQSILISGSDVRLKKFGFPLLEDEVKGKGPVGALATSLKKIDTKFALVLSCDSIDEKLIPLVGIYNQKLSHVFHKSLKENKLKLIDVLKGLNVNLVDPIDESRLYNFNYEKELKLLG